MAYLIKSQKPLLTIFLLSRIFSFVSENKNHKFKAQRKSCDSIQNFKARIDVTSNITNTFYIAKIVKNQLLQLVYRLAWIEIIKSTTTTSHTTPNQFQQRNTSIERSIKSNVSEFTVLFHVPIRPNQCLDEEKKLTKATSIFVCFHASSI